MKFLGSLILFFLAVEFSFSQSVGIGTNNPDVSAVLEVQSTTQGMLVPRMTSTQRGAISNAANGLLVFDLTTNSFWFKGGAQWIELVDNSNAIVKKTGSNIYTALSGENVGIGTTEPSGKLEVKTGSSGEGIVHSNPFTRLATYLSPFEAKITTTSLSALQLNANNQSGQLYLQSDGNVGIGTSNPNEKLHVAGNGYIEGKLKFNDVLDNRKVVVHQGNNNDNEFYGFGINADVLRYQVSATNANHVFYSATSPNNSIELMRITGTGNVGIGTSTPHAPLQFPNTNANRKIVLYEAADNDHEFYGLGISPYVLRYQVSTPDASHVFYTGTAAGSSNEIMRITGTGKVGIGTSNPNAPLQFAATGANRKIVLYESVNNDQQFCGFGVNASTLRYQVDATSSNHVFYAGSSSNASAELMRIQGNGNVGIGISSSNAPLQFATTTANRKIALYDNFNNDHQFYGFGVNSSTLRYQVDSPNSNHVFYAASGSNSSTELMRINGNGNVGIGTNNPTAKLDVNGDVDVAGSLKIGYVRVEGPLINVAGLSYETATCDCPAGMKIIGGGYWSPYTNMNVFKNYPNSESSWFVMAYNNDTSTHDIRAFAICARMAN